MQKEKISERDALSFYDNLVNLMVTDQREKCTELLKSLDNTSLRILANSVGVPQSKPAMKGVLGRLNESYLLNTHYSRIR